jgi:hypothetical protein
VLEGCPLHSFALLARCSAFEATMSVYEFEDKCNLYGARYNEIKKKLTLRNQLKCVFSKVDLTCI